MKLAKYLTWLKNSVIYISLKIRTNFCYFLFDKQSKWGGQRIQVQSFFLIDLNAIMRVRLRQIGKSLNFQECPFFGKIKVNCNIWQIYLGL